MEEAGVDSSAIAHWRLAELQKKVPELGSVVSSAQAVIAQNTSSPTGCWDSKGKILVAKAEMLCWQGF